MSRSSCAASALDFPPSDPAPPAYLPIPRLACDEGRWSVLVPSAAGGDQRYACPTEEIAIKLHRLLSLPLRAPSQRPVRPARPRSARLMLQALAAL